MLKRYGFKIKVVSNNAFTASFLFFLSFKNVLAKETSKAAIFLAWSTYSRRISLGTPTSSRFKINANIFSYLVVKKVSLVNKRPSKT